MAPLLLAVMLAQVAAPADHPPPREIPVDPVEAFVENWTETISFTGRFGTAGAVATIEIHESSGLHAPRPVARILTDECRTKSQTLDFDVVERPLAILDLDGDGRDEIILLEGGNTIYNAVVVRIDDCRLVVLERSDDPHNSILSFYGHSNCCPDSGVGVLCRQTTDGRIEIVTIDHDSWSPWDYSNPDAPVQRPRSEVPWTRTVYEVRGKQLVVTSKDAGTTKIHDDPSVPLLNRFDCLGAVYPPQ